VRARRRARSAVRPDQPARRRTPRCHRGREWRRPTGRDLVGGLGQQRGGRAAGRGRRCLVGAVHISDGFIEQQPLPGYRVRADHPNVCLVTLPTLEKLCQQARSWCVCADHPGHLELTVRDCREVRRGILRAPGRDGVWYWGACRSLEIAKRSERESNSRRLAAAVGLAAREAMRSSDGPPTSHSTGNRNAAASNRPHHSHQATPESMYLQAPCRHGCPPFEGRRWRRRTTRAAARR
jgi:hypothetical protein